MNPDLLELTHTTINTAETAYRRGDLMERRRMLMTDWANYTTEKKEGSMNTIDLSDRKFYSFEQAAKHLNCSME